MRHFVVFIFKRPQAMTIAMNRESLKLFVSVALAWFSISTSSYACDLCALYTAMQVDSPQPGAVRLSASEQYTLLNRVQRDGHFVENVADQYLKSSVTQISGQYDFSNSMALQFVVPVVSRHYRRIEDEEAVRGSESGFGDMTLLYHYIPIRYSNVDTTVRFRLFGGVELPTGDAHLLGEEASAGHHDGAAGEEESGSPDHGGHSMEHSREVHPRHGGVVHPSANVPENAIHGHDLALGSGSFDFPLGMGLTTQWKRFLAVADLQYTIRGEGAYSYRYANDFIWSSAMGAFVYLEDENQVAARVRLSGQYKLYDTGRGGVEFSDTAARSNFIGPELSGNLGQAFQAILGLDIPMDVNNSDLQITGTYRWRAAVTYRF